MIHFFKSRFKDDNIHKSEAQQIILLDKGTLIRINNTINIKNYKDVSKTIPYKPIPIFLKA